MSAASQKVEGSVPKQMTAELLGSELTKALPGFQKVVKLDRISKGVSKEMWSVRYTVARSDGSHSFDEHRACLRRDPPRRAAVTKVKNDSNTAAWGGASLPLTVEAELMTLVRQAGAPSPAVL